MLEISSNTKIKNGEAEEPTITVTLSLTMAKRLFSDLTTLDDTRISKTMKYHFMPMLKQAIDLHGEENERARK